MGNYIKVYIAHKTQPVLRMEQMYLYFCLFLFGTKMLETLISHNQDN